MYQINAKPVLFISIAIVLTFFGTIILVVCLTDISISSLMAITITGLTSMTMIIIIIHFITFNYNSQPQQQPLIVNMEDSL